MITLSLEKLLWVYGGWGELLYPGEGLLVNSPCPGRWSHSLIHMDCSNWTYWVKKIKRKQDRYTWSWETNIMAGVLAWARDWRTVDVIRIYCTHVWNFPRIHL